MRWRECLCLIAFGASLLIPAPAFSQQKLIDVVFARDVVDNEPAAPFEPGAYCERGPEPSDPVPVVDSEMESRIVFWNRIESSAEVTMRHSWYKDNGKVAEIDLKVGISHRWRTWSSKKIIPRLHAGKWKVVVSTLGTDSKVLCTAHFVVK